VRAIGYVRVSTEKQADWGVSLEAQTEKVRAMAVVQGATSLEVIVDAESAKSLNRPGMMRLLSLVDGAEVDVVIIAKLLGAQHNGFCKPVGAGSHRRANMGCDAS
jgi:site-specific DNA recombinase